MSTAVYERRSGLLIPYDLLTHAFAKYDSTISDYSKINLKLLKYKLSKNNIERRKELDLFRAHRALYIHIPKNAGTAITKAAFGQAVPHHSMQYYAGVVPDMVRDFPSFALLRSPEARFVSAFYYLKFTSPVAADRHFGHTVLAPYETPDELVEDMERPTVRSAVCMWAHFRAQCEYVCDIRANLMTTHLGSLERMDAFVSAMSAALDKSILVRPLNRNGMKPETAVRNVDKLERLYELDYSLWRRVEAAPGHIVAK
jgi:hypothetical protein